MSVTVTLTGKCGAGISDTALSISPVTSPVIFNTNNNTMLINGQTYAIDAATSIVATKVGSNYTFVIS